MKRPLCIDLFAGLGGWAEGFLAEGWDVIGFDIERHRYPRIVANYDGQKCPPGGSKRNANGESLFKDKPCHLRDTFKHVDVIEGEWDEYPGQLVLQDVLTLHGSQFKDAACIVASPPCQAYSYRAMPWKRAKLLPPPDNTLFEACFRIQREASEASGCYIPMVVENVCGAQRWVGRARWHYGSYYLWGDVPALMPYTNGVKGFGGSFQSAAVKTVDPSYGTRGWFGDCGGTNVGKVEDGYAIKGFARRFEDTPFAWYSSRSDARKQASALIAKIPFPLAQHIARTFKP